MMKKLSAIIVKWFIENGFIEESDKSIYEFGIRQMLSYVLDFFGMLVIGILFHDIIAVMVISALYMFLQRYAGSYHAPNRVLCYVESMGIITLNTYLFHQINIPMIYQITSGAILTIVILVLAPVESHNKRLDETERQVYWQKARNISNSYLIVCVGLNILGLHIYGQMIVFVLVDILLLQILGKLDLMIIEKIRVGIRK